MKKVSRDRITQGQSLYVDHTDSMWGESSEGEARRLMRMLGYHEHDPGTWFSNTGALDEDEYGMVSGSLVYLQKEMASLYGYELLFTLRGLIHTIRATWRDEDLNDLSRAVQKAEDLIRKASGHV